MDQKRKGVSILFFILSFAKLNFPFYFPYYFSFFHPEEEAFLLVVVAFSLHPLNLL